MRRDDLQELTRQVMEQVVKRRKLGGYSADAEGVLFIHEAVLKILLHLDDLYPRPPKRWNTKAQPEGKHDAISPDDE